MATDSRFPFEKAGVELLASEWHAAWDADPSLTASEMRDRHGNLPGTLAWEMSRVVFYWHRDVVKPLGASLLGRLLARIPFGPA